MGGNLEAWWLSHDPFAKLQGVLPLAQGLFIKFIYFCWYLTCITHLTQSLWMFLLLAWNPLDINTPSHFTHIFFFISLIFSFWLALHHGWMHMAANGLHLDGYPNLVDMILEGYMIIAAYLYPCGIQKEFWAYLTNWCIKNDTLPQTILVLFLLVFHVQSPPVPNANSKYNYPFVSLCSPCWLEWKNTHHQAILNGWCEPSKWFIGVQKFHPISFCSPRVTRSSALSIGVLSKMFKGLKAHTRSGLEIKPTSAPVLHYNLSDAPTEHS